MNFVFINDPNETTHNKSFYIVEIPAFIAYTTTAVS